MASDVDARAVAFARRNLGLLRPEGLARRTVELEDLLRLYGKESHRAALASAQGMRERIQAFPAEVDGCSIDTFTADALDGAALAENLGPARWMW